LHCDFFHHLAIFYQRDAALLAGRIEGQNSDHWQPALSPSRLFPAHALL
jgi:hypothetical protein